NRAPMRALQASSNAAWADSVGAWVSISPTTIVAATAACTPTTPLRLRDHRGEPGVAAQHIECGDVVGQAALQLRELHLGAEREVVGQLAEALRRRAAGVVDEGRHGGEPRVALRGAHARIV